MPKKTKKEETINIVEVFTKAQRGLCVMEICVAKGQLLQADSLVNEVFLLLTQIKKHIGQYMSDDKNHTSKPIPEGTKTPSNNQGVKPNPVGGSTSGSNEKKSKK